MTTIRIDRRYCGPPNSSNGGYVCGRLAQYIPGAAEVTLHAPPPLDTPLDVVAGDDGRWELRDGVNVVASGRPANVAFAGIHTASFEAAWEVARQPPVKEHPLPTCFVCGPAREDGLRIFAGPLARRSTNTSVLAATWIPSAHLASEDGLVAPEFLWAALDCPTGFACAHDPDSGGFERTPILLGRMSAKVERRPHPGERCVITSWATGRDGRKRSAESAVHGEDGTLLAAARATWLVVDRAVQLGQVATSSTGRAEPAPETSRPLSLARNLLASFVDALRGSRREQAERILSQYRSLVGSYDRSTGFDRLLNAGGPDDASR